MKKVGNKKSVYLGILLVLMGVLFNKWFIELTIVVDKDIDSPEFLTVIVAIEVIFILVGMFLLIKRPAARLPTRSEFILLASSIVLAIVIAELFARFVPSSLSYEQVIARSLANPERLFQPNVSRVYDIRGLYDGAGEVTLRTSDNRLIEPEPDFPASYRVLFLGGSTTEAIYVPEDERWVALLNEPGELATYNAGQSGANTLDKYFSFLYLTREKNLHFDLVVLMTAVNDYGWLLRLRQYDGSLRLPNYRDDLRAWHLGENPRSLVQQEFRLFYLAERVLNRMLTNTSKFSSTSSVVTAYRQERDAVKVERLVPLEECNSYNDSVSEYGDNAKQNLRLLAESVAATGGKFLVLSEPVSTKAPSASFHEDFRTPVGCYDDHLSTQDAYTFWNEINQLYLEAAHEAGAFTFDLASNMDPLLNGSTGGRLVYDNMHYTPEGSREVARVLRPVLIDILARNPGE